MSNNVTELREAIASYVLEYSLNEIPLDYYEAIADTWRSMNSEGYSWDHYCPVNSERDELQAISVTVCRKDAAFERTGMCLQRVTEIACNSCLGHHKSGYILYITVISHGYV